MGSLSKADIKAMQWDNYQKAKENIVMDGSDGQTNTSKRRSSVGKGDEDRSIKKLFDKGYDLIRWNSKKGEQK